MRPADILRACERKGIGQIAVTDHNTLRGALEMHALAPTRTIIGEEIMTAQGELLAYFVTTEVPPGLSAVETIARLQRQGAVIVIAHPCDRIRRGAWREEEVAAIAPLVDAIEVFNARCLLPHDNAHALALAQKYAKLGSVGSDAHSPAELGNAVLQLSQPIRDSAGLLAALATAERHTHLASPIMHLTSLRAKYHKRLSNLIRYR